MKKWRHYLIAFSAGVFLSALATRIFNPDDPSTAPPETASQTQPASINAPKATAGPVHTTTVDEAQRPENLAQKPTEQHQPIQNKPLAQQPPDANKDVAIPEPPEWAEASSSNAVPEISQQQLTLDETLRNEDYDPIWANNMQEAAFQLMANAEVTEAILLEAECRTSLCRMTVSVTSPQAQQDLLAYLAQHNALTIDGARGVVFESPDGNGGNLITYYAARQGHSLPTGE